MRTSQESDLDSRFIHGLLCVGAWAALLAMVTTAALAQTGVVAEPKPTESAPLYGRLDATVTPSDMITKPGRSDIERDFVDVTLPGMPDTSSVDHARLVLTVSTVFDSTEPLIIAAFPATGSKASQPTSWSKNWTEMSGGFDPEYMAIASVESSEHAIEVAFDVTQFVRLWQSGALPNHGLVIKSLSENKSTFHWIRDGRYNGQDAKLEVSYSR